MIWLLNVGITIIMKKFKVFNTPYNIKFIDKPIYSDNERTVYGETDFNKKLITISLKDKEGKPRLKSEIEIVLFHELMHCIFGEGQYHRCNDDEPLVEWCARCLYSLREQKVI